MVKMCIRDSPYPTEACGERHGPGGGHVGVRRGVRDDPAHAGPAHCLSGGAESGAGPQACLLYTSCLTQTMIFISKLPPILFHAQVIGNDHPLDLGSALIDLGDLGIAHHALHGVLTGVAVAAEQLDGAAGHIAGSRCV